MPLTLLGMLRDASTCRCSLSAWRVGRRNSCNQAGALIANGKLRAAGHSDRIGLSRRRVFPSKSNGGGTADTTTNRRDYSCRARSAPIRDDSALLLTQSRCQYTPDWFTLSSLPCTITPHPPHLPLMHSEW